jgi:hypothetical protein
VSTCDGDCDDRFAQIKPGAVEVCDAFDNDCDGQTDEGFDQDGDFATDLRPGDCNDGDRGQNPFRREVCGNGIDDGLRRRGPTPTWTRTATAPPTCGGDCNDFERRDAHPSAVEICDGVDQDCDELRWTRASTAATTTTTASAT